ncbi:mechanosensitive ion channel family protein [Alicyclobacillus shizuokensis]|uniref:mechanosensitive ion channel family protein n=1 Tax=Alicyclobacillus shizuokensis TaxID=392014 RepID=UPI0008298528|nr:mechanosensitive ion channel family protein [Alicyclobacillus shizuokensis]MCL6626372.1 mechanosensitive ion channel family protein [Alicyclobacillus shizuokensis]
MAGESSALETRVSAYLQQHGGEFFKPPLNIVTHIIEVVILFFVMKLANRILSRVLNRVLDSRAVRMDERRKGTMHSLMQNILRYTLYFVWILCALETFNFHVGALLAGAGIAGLAVGFGAQSLIKDILTGFFILFEDQYAVGDYVTINGITGEVVQMGLRLTQVRVWTGELEIIPNGLIQQVTNHSRHNSIAVVDIGISRMADVDRALAVLEDVMRRVADESQDVVGPVQVAGVQSLDAQQILLRATAECAPYTHFGVQRLALQRAAQALAEAGIDMPAQRSVITLQGDEQRQGVLGREGYP